MGKNNRQRRAEKHRRRERERGRGPRTDQCGPGPAPRDLADFLVPDAAEAAEHGQVAELEALVAQLAEFDGLARTAMTALVVDGLRAAWGGGWQPADVVRAATKRLGRAHAELAAEMVTMEAATGSGSRPGMPAEWAAQLADLQRPVRSDERRWSGLAQLRQGAGLLGLLMYLPELPHFLPPPAEWGRAAQCRREVVAGADGRVLEKVRVLLAKAESTEFEEEADALTAKAQELMARYSIDQAMVARGSRTDEPTGRRIGVDDPYAQGKANLLAVIASANRCRSIWMSGYGFLSVVGFPSDLEIVEVLYMSLRVQATRAMTTSGAVRDSSGRSRTRSFRQSFMFAFAGRIGERLEAATRSATDAATAVHGHDLLPVLAGRLTAVDEAFESMFPDLVATTVRISNLAGWAAGRAAADLVHLGPDQQLRAGVKVQEEGPGFAVAAAVGDLAGPGDKAYS